MPLLWLSLAFLAGILLGDVLSFPQSGWLVLLVLALLLALSRPLYKPFFRSLIPSGITQFFNRFSGILLGGFPAFPLVLLFLSLGGYRYQYSQPDLQDPDFIASHTNIEEEIVVQGILVKPPEQRDTVISFLIEADQLHGREDANIVKVHGQVLAWAESGGSFQYGDRVAVRGMLEEPTEDEVFDYKGYLARQSIFAVFYAKRVSLIEPAIGGNPILRAIYALRENSHRMIYRLWPDPEASLLAGILLGIEEGIPETVQDDFNSTGTSHIIAISGFNFSIIAGLFTILFNRLLGRWRGAIAAGIGITLYAVLVGAAAAVVRAALMSGLSLFARQIGRRQDGVNCLAVVAALMAFSNPNVLWDVGFQLSFMTTLGLVLYADAASQSFVNLAARRLPIAAAQRLAGPVGEYFLFTLAAQVTGLPIIFYYFRQLSLSSLVANPLILPAQPPVMILGGLAVILGLVFEPFGQLAAYLAWPFVSYTIRVVEMIAKIPGGVIPLGRVGILLVLVYYGIVLGGTFAAPLVQKLLSAMRGEESSSPANNWASALMGFSLLSLAVFNVVAWREVSSLPDGKLHITVLDVSDGTRRGDAILIQSPAGRVILINGGPSSNRLSDALGRRLPLFHRELDYLILADPVGDQIAALSQNIQRFAPANVLWAGPLNASIEARVLREGLVEAGIPILSAQTGQSLDLGSGARLRFLSTGRRGAILCLEWGNFRALLPIGANFEDLEYLDWGREVGPITALLLADHGYPPANPPTWIANLQPQVLLLSAAARDAQDFDSLEVFHAFQGYHILNTGQNGWIHLSTDGEELWLEVEKSR